jgi:HlyD family secretion protein
MNDIATPETGTIDEFLGTTTRPRWRRWAKFWIPGAIVLLVLIYVISTRDDNKTDYIAEPVAERSLDITVTATGNLPPTNQVQVGS